MKRILSLVLIISLLSGIVVFADAGIFDSSDLSESQIKDLYDLGIMTGDENGNLRLNDRITRAEAAKMICVTGNIKPVYDITENIFGDVSASHWAYGYICALKDKGIVQGDELGNFNPQKSITNEEIIKMIVVLLGYRELAEQLGGYPAGYNGAATGLGITNNMKLIPKTDAVRKSVAMMLCNSLDVPIMVKKDEDNDEGNEVYVILNGKNGIPFSSVRGTRGMVWDVSMSTIDKKAQALAYQYPYKEGDEDKAISLYPDITYLTAIEKAQDGREYECPAVYDDRHAYELLSSMTVDNIKISFGEKICDIRCANYNSELLVPYDTFDIFGYDVSFHKETYVSAISDGDTVLEIIPNIVCMRKNKAQGYWVPLKVCARFIDDTLYVPLDAVLREFGLSITEFADNISKTLVVSKK